MSDESYAARLERQREFFANRLKKRFRHLWKYAKRVETNAFRVYHRDIPEIPLTVDWYNNHLVIAEFARPYEESEEEHQEGLRALTETAARTLTVHRERVFLKVRKRLTGSTQYERVNKRRYEIEIEERGLRFIVNLSDYIDTGLFLDHRDLRLYVARMAAGKSVLNLFGYTGAFSVYCGAAGAREIETLDLSNTYLRWAERTMALNGLTNPEYRFRRVDVLEEIPRLAETRRRFDIIVLDPPSFSNSKNMRSTWDVQRDHAALINSLLQLLRPGGRIYFSTNKRRFRLENGRIESGAIIDITKRTMPDDFADTGIHKAWSIDAPGAHATRRSPG